MASSRNGDSTSADRSTLSSTPRRNSNESQELTGRRNSLSAFSTTVLVNGKKYRRKKPSHGVSIKKSLSFTCSKPTHSSNSAAGFPSLSSVPISMHVTRKGSIRQEPVAGVSMRKSLSFTCSKPTQSPNSAAGFQSLSSVPISMHATRKGSIRQEPVAGAIGKVPSSSAPTYKPTTSASSTEDSTRQTNSARRRHVARVLAKASSSSDLIHNRTQSTTSSVRLRSVQTIPTNMHTRGMEISGSKPEAKAMTSSSIALRHESSQSQSSTAGFRSLSIFPTVEDLKEKSYVRPNKVFGAYDSIEDYLDVQLRLLREDVFAPLRDGVEQYLQQIRLRQPVDQLKDVDVYTGVFVIGAAASTWGMTYKIRFDSSQKQDKLKQGKRLIFGSQVVLSADNFDTIYVATVQDSNSENTMQGELEVAFEPQYARKMVDIELCTTEFVMIETAAYFEAYRHVLEGLKEIDSENFPFRKYIVECNCPIKDHPQYLHNNSTYDLSCVAPTEQQCQPELKCVRVLQTDSWPSASQLSLDQSQFDALHLALTREFAIIQGPPGTGKTFIGLKIAKVLLSNCGKSSLEDKMSSLRISQSSPQSTPSSSANSPILVVCFTNHALDQFLEGILDFTPEGVIRVGSRSNSEKLKKCALSKQNQSGVPPFMWKRNREIQKVMKKKRQAAMGDTHRATLSDRAIFKYSVLEKHIHMNHVRQMRSMDLVQWLNLEQLCATQSNLMNGTEMSAAEIKALGEERKLELEQRLVDAYDFGNLKLSNTEKKTLNEIEECETYVNLCSFIGESNAPSRTLKGDINSLLRNPANSRLMLSKLRSSKPLTADEERRVIDARRIDVDTRWRLYLTWVCRYRNELMKNITSVCHDYDELAQQIRELKTESNACVLQKAKVIGMTTTGAARMRHVLQRIKPRVVIVEEAAEVLEAHVVTTLSSGCQHVILIGDHQQLRPNPTVHELAKNYKLDVSLFERMVNNRLPFKTLLKQHRMKPEFSAIMRNHFYEQLQDSPGVRNREKVRGLENDMFYLSHTEMEEQDSNQSYCNHHEASLVVAMCRYLLKQGYSAEKITVLTPYSGQLALVRTKIMSSGENICISSVDGYQGEQNDIVLLSLVRSNDRGVLGFMNTSNRICVALSRARLGLYVFGNFKMLAQSSRLWRRILRDVKKNRMLGKDLTLACENHRTINLVRCAKDFERISSGGGCQKPCTGNLRCGHPCPKKCHGVPHHMATWKCLSNDECQEVFEPCKHQCPRRCREPCPKRCTKKVIHEYNCGDVEYIECCQISEAKLCGRCTKPLCTH